MILNNILVNWLTAIGTISATIAAVAIASLGNKEYRDSNKIKKFYFLKDQLIPFLKKSELIYGNKLATNEATSGYIETFVEEWVKNSILLSKDLNHKIQNILHDANAISLLSNNAASLTQNIEEFNFLKEKLQKIARSIINDINNQYKTTYRLQDNN